MDLILGLATLGFLLLLLLAKMLTSLELRARESECRHNQARIFDVEQDLDTSRRKYLLAIKAEGVAKHRLSQSKTRLASLRQHLEQLQHTAKQHADQRQKDQEKRLEGLVMQALGGASVRRDSQFKRVMKVIRKLVDIETGDSEQVMAAIQEKIGQMGRQGLIEAAEKGIDEAEKGERQAESPEEAPAQAGDETGDDTTEDSTNPQAAVEKRPATRKDLVRGAMVKKR